MTFSLTSCIRKVPCEKKKKNTTPTPTNKLLGRRRQRNVLKFLRHVQGSCFSRQILFFLFDVLAAVDVVAS